MSDAGLELDAELTVGARTLRATLRTTARRVGLEGPSGAGKSTLLEWMLGFARGAGRLVVDGRALQDSARGVCVPAWQRGLAWVPQDALAFPHATVRENLAWSGAAAGEVDAVLEELGLRGLEGRAPRVLSGGERQRVALGRALLCDARWLLLDEPFSALDPAARERVAELVFARAAKRGQGILLVTHDAQSARERSDARYYLGEDGALRGTE